MLRPVHTPQSETNRLRTVITAGFTPVVLFAVLMIGVIVLWQISLKQEEKYHELVVAERAEETVAELRSAVKEVSTALQRYARRVEYLGLKDRGYLELDSNSYVTQLDILRRVGITDPKLNVIWSYPEAAAAQVKDFNQGIEAERRAAFLDAIENKHPSLSQSVKLRSGVRGFVLPEAMYKDGELKGVVYGAIDAEKLFAKVSQSPDFHLQVRESGLVLFEDTRTADASPLFASERAVEIGISKWHLTLWPTNAYLTKSRSWTPIVILFGGSALALLTGLIAHSVASASRNRRQSAQWQKAVLDEAHHPIISTDANGIIQTFNAAAEQLLGYKAADLIGKETPAILHDRAEVKERAEALSLEFGYPVEPGGDVFTLKARTTGKADENEWTYVHKDGSRFPVSLSLTAVKNGSGDVYGYIGIATDLTEKKRAENELREAHDRLKRIIESTGAGIWERDYSSGRVEMVDTRGREIYGFRPDEQPTMLQVIEIIHPEDREGLSDIVARHVREGTPRFECEFRIAHKPTHSERWVRAVGQVGKVNGEPKRLTATLTDVTERIKDRKRLEVALLQAESATKAKSAFLANMSHEIRTPLNGVIGLSDLLLGTDLNPVQRGYASVARQSGMTLLRLINDILDFSKIEAGKMELNVGPVDAADLIEGQADVLMARAKEKGISLVSFVTPELGAFMGDVAHLEQVLLNLIGNAIKFTEQGGVFVSATLVTKENGPAIHVSVRDSGIGISAENIGKMFSPFTQADSRIGRKFGGTGLGLSIAKRLVEMMGGLLNIESRVGEGSTFWFEIPYSVPPFAVVDQTLFANLDGQSVLLLTEDAFLQQSVGQYLEYWHAGTSIAGFANPPAGGNFDYVLLAPGEAAGESALIYLRATKASKREVIYIAPFGAQIDESALRAEGVKTILRRPLKRDLLAGAFNPQAVVVPITTVTGDRSTNLQRLQERSRVSVLVADDQPVNRMVAQSMLESLGFGVVMVDDGKQAIDALMQQHFDLILMDCHMPVMDGFEATRLIRELAPAAVSKIPIVALTANVSGSDAKMCLDAGMDDFLSKPVLVGDLERMMEKWLSQPAKRA